MKCSSTSKFESQKVTDSRRKYVLRALEIWRKPSGRMKPTQLHIISDGKMIGRLDLRPAMLQNLKAFAKANSLSLPNMIDLAIRFTTNPEKESVDLECPDERALIESK
jgi:hypothetical protein